MNFYDDEKRILGILNNKKALKMIVTNEKGKLNCRAERFSGIQTIAKIKVSNSQRLHLEFNVVLGKAKLVSVNDKKITVLSEGNKSGETIELMKGLNRLRIVGESSDLSLIITTKILAKQSNTGGRGFED